jgi:hypothetical protein
MPFLKFVVWKTGNAYILQVMLEPVGGVKSIFLLFSFLDAQMPSCKACKLSDTRLDSFSFFTLQNVPHLYIIICSALQQQFNVKASATSYSSVPKYKDLLTFVGYV